MHACSPQLLEGRGIERMQIADVSCGDSHLACITGRRISFSPYYLASKIIIPWHIFPGNTLPRVAGNAVCLSTEDGRVFTYGSNECGQRGSGKASEFDNGNW